MNKDHKRIGRRFVLVFWSSFLIVIILNILVWLYLNQTEKQFESQLRDRLTNASQLMGRLISEYSNEFNIHLLLPGDESSAEYLFYHLMLENIRQQSNLQSLIIVSPQGEILVSSPKVLGNARILSLSHRSEFQQAVNGNISLTGIERYAGERFLTSFAPLQDMDGFILGILVIEVRAEYFETITNLRNQLLLFSVLNFLLVLIIAYFLFRMIRKTIFYEREIQEQEHLVQLGTMAASVAHELRNPLGIIEATNDLIRKKYGQNDDEVFQYIPEEIKRLSGLIDDFLTFARAPKLQIESFRIRTVTDWLMLNLTEEEQKRFSIELDENAESFKSDKNLIQQILLNLVINALQATEKDGHVSCIIQKQGRRQFEVLIKDDGTGIKPENIDKIFTPFFTTREKGTGLGLAITNRLISHLQGTIEVSSVDGQGTTVKLFFPELNKQ